MNGFRHKDVWRKGGKHFLVTIEHFTEEPSQFDYGDDDGRHRWCVYAYIYPKHPHFGQFSGDSIFQEAASVLPLHAGPSYLRYHYDDNGKEVTSVQVGADYNHLHDNRFTHYATSDDAKEVFNDAERLFERLTSMHEPTTPTHPETQG
jgi:hypothetical protein